VGNGPFPTELTDSLGEQLRARGDEYGATTGRPRRCGWLDAVALRRATRVSGITGLAVTKLDVLRGFDPLRICVGYRLDGATCDDLPPDAAQASRLEPIYEDLPGFSEDIGSARSWTELPAAARSYLQRLSELARVPLLLVSVGPARAETILLDNPFGDE
jgi:adenylosuccinate synthase